MGNGYKYKDESENPKIYTWEELMEMAVTALLTRSPYSHGLAPEHIKKTPKRVVEAYKEAFSGCLVHTRLLLESALFPSENHTQMIHVGNIRFYSTCMHHMALISGVAHFAYIPGEHMIGISKIPRLVDAYARRPQVQELMSNQIVDDFVQFVKPKGCGISVTADHACMQCRGARAQTAFMRTTALRGNFLENAETKEEFLMSVKESR